ncbi:hypothetical protein Stube_15770 [Streptomyces tubercidicus]|uniref:Uncharacterized protein n=1 Tax=Streptomyces tubercidicus TaxID=47759 RepID=A0A640UNH8_9ACTN|nr:hypothetical protein Stube_15770 [Streptomyces tubercidicus]
MVVEKERRRRRVRGEERGGKRKGRPGFRCEWGGLQMAGRPTALMV